MKPHQLALFAGPCLAAFFCLVVPCSGQHDKVARQAKAAWSEPGDKDTDGDGLSDYQEKHKYRTDPHKKDSDGDGVPDGHWLERREFTYTVRSVVQVLRPVNLAAIQDDYQDARVLDETREYVELEVIHYPFNTNHAAITGDKDWRTRPKELADRLAPYLAAGVTTNWDAGMRADLLKALREDGIDVTKLTDKEVVEKVSDWALSRATPHEYFTTYATWFPKGRPEVHPALESKFENGKGDPSWSVREQWERELFGKGMYYNKCRGTCTSSAVYLTTVLRAVGIPTRMVVVIPAVDASDPRNRRLVERLQHHRLRHALDKAVTKLERSFTAHTFNEVFVGGRWRRLDYDRLGANIRMMGLATHVNTFKDLSEAGLARGWGANHPSRKPSLVFRHKNPYHALTLSDRFGPHARIDNPDVADGHRTLTVGKAYWFDSDKDRPRKIGADWHGARDKRAGHVLVHVAEFERDDGGDQYDRFFAGVDKRFQLRASGQKSIQLTAWRCWWPDIPGGGTAFYLRIDERDMARMKRGVRYRLHALNTGERYRWKIRDPLHLVRR